MDSCVTDRYFIIAAHQRETLRLPPIESPKLHIRLSEDARFFQEIVVQEVTKPRYDSVTFKSYCEHILKRRFGVGQTVFDVTRAAVPPVASSHGCHATVAASVAPEPRETDPGTSTASPKLAQPDSTSSDVKLDYAEMQRKLTAGVGIEVSLSLPN